MENQDTIRQQASLESKNLSQLPSNLISNNPMAEQ